MYAHVNGTKLYFDVDGAEYEVVGKKLRKKPVCFVVHGGPGGNHIGFKPYLNELKETMQLIYVDQRGSGFSEEDDVDTLTLDYNVADLEALRKHLGLDKVWILGHSYGGMVAMGYALKYQQYLHGLLLVTTASRYTFLDMAKDFVKKHGTPEQKTISEKLWAGDFQSDEEIAEFYKQMAPFYSVKEQEEGPEPRPATRRSFVALNKGFGGFMRDMDMLEDLAGVKVPALVIAGKYDWITPPAANEEIAAKLPRGEYRLFEQSSHKVMRDENERFVDEIQQFVAGYS